nr:LysE family transporter [Streptomyces albiflavescens]
MDGGMVTAFLAVDLLLVCAPGADWAYAISAGLRGRSVFPAVSGLVAGYAVHTLLAVAGLAVLVAGSPGLLTALTVAGAGYLVWLGWGVLRSPATPGTPGTSGTPGAAGGGDIAAPVTAGADAVTVTRVRAGADAVAPMAVGTDAVASATVGTDAVASATVGTDAVARVASAEPPEPSPARAFLRGAAISGLNPKGLLLYLSVLPQFLRPAAGAPVAAQTAVLGLVHMACCAAVYLGVGVLARVVLGARPAAARAVARTSGAAMLGIGGFLLVERLATL